MITETIHKIDIDLIDKALYHIPEDITLNEPTNNFFYDKWNIKSKYKDTIWEALLNSLNETDLGEARILILEPGEVYQAHADIDDRYHLNLLGEQSYLVNLDDQKMYKLCQDGCWYLMNTEYIHTACNFGAIPRIQLVVRKLLNHGIIENPVDVTIDPKIIDSKKLYNSDKSYRYNFDKIFSPWLNRANKLNLLDNFKITKSSVSFTTDISQLEYLNSINDGFIITTNVSTS